MKINSEWLGLCDYEYALNYQKQLLRIINQTKKPLVIGLEHPTVVTLGRRANRDYQLQSHLNSENTFSKEDQIKVIAVERGGEATLHSPGQLVIYPIFPIQYYGIEVKNYVSLLLMTSMDLLKKYNIDSNLSGRAGLETNVGKIVFCGIRVSSGISYHGISINVKNDLELFKRIRPCGIEGQVLDSFKSRGVDALLWNLFEEWMELFCEKLDQIDPPGLKRNTNKFLFGI